MDLQKNTYFRKLRKSLGNSRGSSERPGWAPCLEFHRFPPKDKLSTRTDQYVDLFKLQKLVGGVAEILDGLKSLDKAVKTLEDELFLEVPRLAHFPLLFVLLLLLLLVLVLVLLPVLVLLLLLVLLSFVLVVILFEVWGTLGFVLLEKTLKWGREFWPKSTWNWFLNSLSVFSEAFTLSKASSTCFSFRLLPAGHNITYQGHKTRCHGINTESGSKSCFHLYFYELAITNKDTNTCFELQGFLECIKYYNYGLSVSRIRLLWKDWDLKMEKRQIELSLLKTASIEKQYRKKWRLDWTSIWKIVSGSRNLRAWSIRRLQTSC